MNLIFTVKDFARPVLILLSIHSRSVGREVAIEHWGKKVEYFDPRLLLTVVIKATFCLSLCSVAWLDYYKVIKLLWDKFICGFLCFSLNPLLLCSALYFTLKLLNTTGYLFRAWPYSTRVRQGFHKNPGGVFQVYQVNVLSGTDDALVSFFLFLVLCRPPF